MNQTFNIDDITWNDLSMEEVYHRINTAQSSVGQEYLKKVLRTTLTESEPLEARSDRASYLSGQSGIAGKLDKIFKNLGKTKKISLYDYIFRFHEIKPQSNVLHYILILLLLAAVALIFLNPVIGIIALVVMFVINISTYFKYKASVESYFMCFKYIVKMLRAASQVLKIEELRSAPFADLCAELAKDTAELAAIRRGSWLLTNSVSGSLVDVIMDYVRMLFHVDIIKFNQMRNLAAEKEETIDHLFCTLGEIETDLCISRFRNSLKNWCLPEFSNGGRSAVNQSEVSGESCSVAVWPEFSGKGASVASRTELAGKRGLTIRGMYHPLTEQIVTNDITVRKSVLLTGSNASGKSTFLKQLAINQILAQTISTCLAEVYRTGFYKVLSSMALADNILGSESYFIVEIKSLKRIFDEISEEKEALPVMCFIDEVLRGTNTKERIAASSQILKNMSGRNVLCFAATHDIELTQLLAEDMDNYHFEEYVNGNDVTFDYKLKEGPARTRNAIRLMRAYGFDPSITDAADQLADKL